MTNTFGDKRFVARLCDDLFPADDEFEPSLHNRHQFVRRMDEIIPLSSRSVNTSQE